MSAGIAVRRRFFSTTSTQATIDGWRTGFDPCRFDEPSLCLDHIKPPLVSYYQSHYVVNSSNKSDSVQDYPSVRPCAAGTLQCVVLCTTQHAAQSLCEALFGHTHHVSAALSFGQQSPSHPRRDPCLGALSEAKKSAKSGMDASGPCFNRYLQDI